MMLRLRKATGLFSGAALVSLVAAALFIGCQGDYGTVAPNANTSDFLSTGRTLSFFTAIQVDPRSEDSAGPQFVVAADLDSDGLMDLVSAWNETQPVQIHLQRRTETGAISFETVTLAGNIPAVSVSGLAVTDFDRDGAPDIAVMLKETLLAGAGCLDSEVVGIPQLSGLILIYLGPAAASQVNQALAWEEVPLEAARLAGSGGVSGTPEVGGFTSMAIGDMDSDGDMDVIAAWNSSCGGGSQEVVVFSNQGSGAVRDGTWSAVQIPNPAPLGTAVKDVALGDIDLDGDLDIVATYPDAASMNLRWFRNPLPDDPDMELTDDLHISDGAWHVGTVGQLPTKADIVRLADVDMDGLLDVIARSSDGGVIQWFKGPGFRISDTLMTSEATTEPVANIPWQVYTISEFRERAPHALAVGDLNFDGQVEVIASGGGALLWLDAQSAPSVYDQWIERLIIDDAPAGQAAASAATTDPNVDPSEIAGETFINSILIVDLDGDGANDLVATFDRTGLSGLTNDALVWFRNTQRPPS